MHNRLLPAIFVAAALWTPPPLSAQVQIDTSTPESVMASLAGLHESWTLVQFTEFMRAAMVSRMPDEVEEPASWQGPRNRWEFLPDALALFAGISISVPFILESDPYVDVPNPEKFGPWLRETLHHGLEGRTIDALVRFGRNRERAVLIELRKTAVSQLREFEEHVEHAAAAASRPIQDRRAIERLQRRLADVRTHIERLDRRLHELEGMGEFAPGAVGCSFDQAIDLSTSGAMMADLETLADTCAQKHLIRFLRAAAFVSEVPVGLAEPGVRMDGSALLRANDNLSSALQAISGLAAVLQEDPLIWGTDSVPERLRKILVTALEGRSVADVIRDGDKLERAFLPGLRKHLTQELDDEIERRRGEMFGQGTAAPQRSSPGIRRLRAKIERIDRRLALLQAPPPADEQALAPD